MKKLFLSFLAASFIMGISFADEEVGEEIELSSAVITAKSCAEKAKETGSFELLSNCPPVEAAKTGYVVYDVTENTFYSIAPKNVYFFELDEGFGGSIDVSGKILGKEGDLPVIEVQDYKISPKPKAGFFKGCL